MTKHTPAPWSFTGFDGGKMAEVRVDGKLACLMSIFGKKTTEEDNANLRLIAAAPDLLEALISLKDWVELEVGCELPNDKIDEAIAKATGEKIENVRRFD